MENILNDANQLLKKVREKYYEKAQELCLKRPKDACASRIINHNLKLNCSNKFQTEKKCCYNEYCSKLKKNCKEENGSHFLNPSKILDSNYKRLCFHSIPETKTSSIFPKNSFYPPYTYHQSSLHLGKNSDCILTPKCQSVQKEDDEWKKCF